jgi:hypothetical protein
MVWLWAACFAQANVRTASIAQIRREEMPLASARLEDGNPCWQGVSFESQARLGLELRIGILCGGDPVNHFDPDGRLGVGYYRGMSSDDSTGDFTLDFAGGMLNDVFNLGARAVNGIAQGGLIVGDMVMQSLASANGYGGYYQGNSQLYQNIYNNPSSGPSGGQILTGTLQTEANIATLGAYGMAQGTYNGVQTGNWNQAQDASLNALLLSGGAQAMQSAGVNPWGAGYVPNAADQALLSLVKSDSSTTPDAAGQGMMPQLQQQQLTGPVPASGGASPTLGSLTPSQANTIQAFADRFNAEVNVVGSRAAGTAGPSSDFDYVIGGNASLRNSASYYLPRGAAGGEISGSGIETGIDIFNANRTPLDPGRPFIQFAPGQAPIVGPQ